MAESSGTLKSTNLAGAFLESAGAHPQKTAFYYEEDGKPKEISFSAFIRYASGVARLLIEAGAGAGERVAILAPSGLRWCVAFTGGVLAGSVVVPVNETAPEAEQRAVLEDASPKIVFVSAETEGLPALAGFPDVRRIGMDRPGFLAEAEPPDGEALKASPDDIAVLLYTSGTTGLPKGVMLSHGNLLPDVRAILATGLVTSKENIAATLPLFHAYPLMCTFVAPFLAGASVTLVPKISELQRTLKEKKPSILVAVPQMLEMIEAGLRRKVPRPLMPLHSLSSVLRSGTGLNIGKKIFGKAHEAFGGRLAIMASGGAKLKPAVMKGLEGFGFTVVEGYGLTETSPVVTFNPIEKRKPGSAGRPVEGAEVRIEEGEILLRGPMVTKGYRGKPKETAQAIRDGWFHTGDLGYLDGDGYLFITGRKKEIIVLSSGKNIAPEEVENHYARSPLIKEIGVYDEQGSLKAVIVPDLEYARREDLGNLGEAVRAEVTGLSLKLPAYMRLSGFDLVKGPLPRTSLGKLKRYKLAALIGQRPVEGPDRELLADPAGRKVAEALKEVIGPEAVIRGEKNLELDYGVDSLKRLELAGALEEKFLSPGQRLPDQFMAQVQTVGDMVEKIKSLRPEELTGEVEAKAETALPGPVHRALAPIFLALVKGLMKALWRVEGHGQEKVPPAPFIIAPNHTSFLDGFAVGAVLPAQRLKKLYFQGFVRYFTGPMAFFAKIFHVIPIDPDAYLGSAMRRSEEALARGDALCIFPEGGRSIDGGLTELKKGTAALALKTGVPVVPAWIEGAWQALPRGRSIPRFNRIKVRFGEPMDPKRFERPEDFLAELRELMLRLRDM